MSIYECSLTDDFRCKPLFTVVDSAKSLHASGLFHADFRNLKIQSFFRKLDFFLFSSQFMHFFQLLKYSPNCRPITFSQEFWFESYLYAFLAYHLCSSSVQVRLKCSSCSELLRAEGKRTAVMASHGGCSLCLGIYWSAKQSGGLKGTEI